MKKILKQLQRNWYFIIIPLVASFPSVFIVGVAGIFALVYGVNTKILLITPIFSTTIAYIPNIIIGLTTNRNKKKLFALYLIILLIHIGLMLIFVEVQLIV